MTDPAIKNNNKQIAIWLLIGVAMIMIQVLLGGITRLTESGLSITEWKPITGALPPLNDQDWAAAFEKYRSTDQFKYVHKGFTISDFKFIFFWEWFHRLWARFMGFVFLIGFVYFLITKKFQKKMIQPMVILFVLGALQGAIGWIMVKSGLVPEKYFVGHIQLATHFIAAMGLLCYTLWFALSLLPLKLNPIQNARTKKLLVTILILLIVQLTYGAFMAGLKAAATAPTWPDINGSYFPANMNEMSPWLKNIFYNPIMIHFIHRGVAYLLLIIVIYTWVYNRKASDTSTLFNSLMHASCITILLQLILGIATVLNATFYTRLLFLGVSHQFTAMLFLCWVVCLLYLSQKKLASDQ